MRYLTTYKQTNTWKAEIVAHNAGILAAPHVMADRAPDVSLAHLDPPLVLPPVRPVHQPHGSFRAHLRQLPADHTHIFVTATVVVAEVVTST